MNRKQRRAALKQSPSSGLGRGSALGNATDQLFFDAVSAQQQHRLDEAVRIYKRLLQLKPDHAEASNNLGCMLQAQGKLREASAVFARTLALMPQLLNAFAPITATLTGLLPPLSEAMRRADAAWPSRLSIDRLFADTELATVASDPLLLAILQSTPVCSVALERLLTSVRAALLEQAVEGAWVDEITLVFCCALALQCFINEYVFAVTPEEEARLAALKSNLDSVTPVQLAALAMYTPLHALANAQSLLERKWPRVVDKVVTQQLREPMRERALRDSIERLTPIDDNVSLQVRQQYEENPYPRWVHIAGNVEPMTVAEYMSGAVPGSTFASLAANEAPDVLVAGCGTGSLPIELTRKLSGARVLAIDLSLTSLAYAKRKTPPEIAGRLSYAQADILKLGAIGRTFDIIDASGVLHHMADPAAGFRTLLTLLRPAGLMDIGLYSKTARRDITEAQKYVSEKGYRPTVADIRRARQDILNSELHGVARIHDFFSTSECRDLLFHVQEHQMTISQIKSLVDDNGVRFIGFAFDPMRTRHYAAAFAQAGKSLADLDAWQDLEMRHPETFISMYQFWVQKPAA
jgi:2-polyprenyl-3-methyl-5-hydroxy-6-metoxy-1,4-benzoquinol methylase